MSDSWRIEPDDKDVVPATPATQMRPETYMHPETHMRPETQMHPETHMRNEDDRQSGRLDAPADSPAPAPEITARRSAATGYGDLAAIIRLQSTEMERLAFENERLMERLETFFGLHENDQRLRQDLQEQIQHLNERAEACAPAQDADTIRREVRESMIEEIKPVMVAILELLERSLERPAEAPAGTPAQASPHPLAMEGLLRLPEILTRPLEELTSPVGKAPAGHPGSGSGAPGPSERSNGAGQSRRPARPDRQDARDSALPGVFAWTNLFA